MITTALTFSCHWKSLLPFCLRKEIPEKFFSTNSELPQNGTEKQIMPIKTILNWLFNDIRCYLVIYW